MSQTNRRSYDRDAQSGRYRSPVRPNPHPVGTTRGPTLNGRSTVPFSRPSSVPGPGAYSPQHVGPGARKSGPAFSIGARHNSRSGEFHPGPGAYYPERSGEMTRHRAGYSFGARHHSMDDRSPGPAAYHPHATRSGRQGRDRTRSSSGRQVGDRTRSSSRLASKSNWPIDGRIRSDTQGHGGHYEVEGRRRPEHYPHPVDHRYDHPPRYHGDSHRYQYVTDGGRAAPPYDWDPYYYQRGGGRRSPYGDEYYQNGARRPPALDDYRPTWGATRGRVLGPVGTGTYHYRQQQQPPPPPPPDDVMMTRVARGHPGHVVVGRTDKSAVRRRQHTRPPDR